VFQGIIDFEPEKLSGCLPFIEISWLQNLIVKLSGNLVTYSFRGFGGGLVDAE
jgi:hypothetical protein